MSHSVVTPANRDFADHRQVWQPVCQQDLPKNLHRSKAQVVAMVLSHPPPELATLSFDDVRSKTGAGGFLFVDATPTDKSDRIGLPLKRPIMASESGGDSGTFGLRGVMLAAVAVVLTSLGADQSFGCGKKAGRVGFRGTRPS